MLLAVETGLSAYFLPELEKMLATTQENPHHCFDVGHHSLAAISHINDLGEQAGFRTKERVMLAYAALLHDVAKPEVMTVDTPVAVQLGFMGTIPNYGISYVDGGGNLRRFALVQSGYDGSVLLDEADPLETQFIL